MSFLREVFFVLMVFAPLVITLPLVASSTIQKALHSFFSRIFALVGRPLPPYGEKPKVEENYKFWVSQILLIGIFELQHYLFGYTNYWNTAIVTALAIGIYVLISYAHRRTFSYVYIIFIIYSGLFASILIDSFKDGYSGKNLDMRYDLVIRDLETNDIKPALIKYSADKTFPAGYIEKNSPILTSLPATEEKDIGAEISKIGYSWRIVHRWHTPITGLYYVNRQKAYLWYPGGKIKEEINNIRWQKKTGE